MKEDMEKLKLKKSKLEVTEKKQEKVYITKHVEDLNNELNRKIEEKQNELDQWDQKMTALVHQEPFS